MLNSVRALAVVAALGALASAGSAAAGTETVGVSDGQNCYPFSCFAFDGGSVYQEQYRAGAFSGPLNVDSVTFLRNEGGPMDSATYHVQFYLSGTDFGSMSSDLGANLGTELSDFGSFNLGGDMPSELTLDGHNFSYDPADGNLLMQVTVSNAAPLDDYYSFFQADYTGADVLRTYAYTDPVDTVTNDTGALVTQFNTVAPGGVPEPASWALMILGVGGLGAMLRRRRASGAMLA